MTSAPFLLAALIATALSGTPSNTAVPST
jgi:hypothetical protein